MKFLLYTYSISIQQYTLYFINDLGCPKVILTLTYFFLCGNCPPLPSCHSIVLSLPSAFQHTSIRYFLQYLYLKALLTSSIVLKRLLFPKWEYGWTHSFSSIDFSSICTDIYSNKNPHSNGLKFTICCI